MALNHPSAHSPIRRGCLAIVLLATAIASCTTPEPVLYAPEMAGVVKTRTLVGKDLHFELLDGRVFVRPANMDYMGGQPQVDDLLLAGSSPDAWVYRASPQGEPNPNGPICYQLFGETRANAAQVFKRIQDPARGDVTIVVPKVLNWHDVGASGDKLFGVVTCINEDGKAFEQRFGSAEG
jgi:hypothetical protein